MDGSSVTGYSCQCLDGFHIEHLERQCVRGLLADCKNSTGSLLHPPCDYVAGNLLGFRTIVPLHCVVLQDYTALKTDANATLVRIKHGIQINWPVQC